ncbi:MAG: tRNA uridine(34) 5-carboxymethylaminomethyl modification radical SAM/GNAT enzyme Elp3 [Candidatus Bathyarchaeota archaeon]|nr:tRNA uridine(34) 5-carboxymethylaminomethyl modification radical SAM/GNAT enzyme Elp3 [Candidatus Bathyarchaeota archaeon]MDH5623704.1 tRNA uridine(34) 5-carboxymethylaminomethyl modification radical SAM/GNAT enzyme Elp3 [Candidatus Bathyarchaeota archaeon]MDH5635811.1 tRNA uridine(34) 5-carboxymethylaminomethyl modification radical SAM/GNAT enzyme Elp3 [Candidatus Bathyarchaeota archaeon]MDH5702117.1 tRNA uridine(34) 5-carboxymethylaminomethyl modification radical SAM/GNAT enzyme Elp3 [Candi
MSEEAYREIIQRLMEIPNPTKDDVSLIKVKVAGKHDLGKVPSNSELIRHLKPDEKDKLLPILRRKIVRTISGVTIVAVMTKPWPCPQKNPCAYCPGGPAYGVPQSYTGHEPAAMRGLQSDFDPYEQVRNRIEQLKAIGHMVDKVELVIMGGTFPSMPLDYQKHFVKECLNAVAEKKTRSLEEAKKLAETSRTRNVGITVETRPDWAKEKHVDQMLSMGTTRVELGVQNVYNDIYELVERGHSVQDVVEATRILKDAGLKVAYHLMPGLPGSSFERDLEGFQRIFTDSRFKPDMIKIYPCLVLKGTKAYDWWRKGEYQPYTTEEAAQLILEIKKTVPPWIRIMRVQRDIPAYLIEAGVDRSNLRQLVLQRLKEEGVRCLCIRCREVGHRWLKDKVKPDPNSIEIRTIKEKASEGDDVFISAEDPANDVLVGYLRLRIPSEKAHRSEIVSETTAIVRELHVYGPLVPVGRHLARAWQHKGYGGILLSEAERISLENYERRKVIVTSALGTKQYYRRFGYDYDGPYVSKFLVE